MIFFFNFIMNKNLIELLIGTILGDASLRQTKNYPKKASIYFGQSSEKKEYVEHLYAICKVNDLVKTEIKERIYTDSRYNTENKSLQFNTKSMIELNFLADLFQDVNGKKIIPADIKDYLSLVTLAYWVCDDGLQVKKGGITLCTDSFTIEEINLLRDALKLNFNLETSIHNKKGKEGKSYNRIYIFLCANASKGARILKLNQT